MGVEPRVGLSFGIFFFFFFFFSPKLRLGGAGEKGLARDGGL